MSGREELLVTRLAEVARQSAPPALGDEAAAEMVRRAVGGARRGQQRRRVAWTVAASIAAAAAVALVTTAAFEEGRKAAPVAPRVAEVPRAAPLLLELPTGDRLTVTAGARFEIESQLATERRIALSEGAMLFEVARLGADHAFEVRTPHLDVRVLGTVFSVQATTEQTTVRVFEGRVEVRDGAVLRVLRANQALASSGGVRALDADAPLSPEGRRAAALRAGEAGNDGRPMGGNELPLVTRMEEPGEALDPAPGPLPARPAQPSLDEARRWIVAGDAERARNAARAAVHEGAPVGPWCLLEGDALRALGRRDEAANSYDRAAATLSGSDRAQAAYLAASVRFRAGDVDGALATLSRSGEELGGSPLAERSAALEVRALVAAGRAEEAAGAARRYLDRHPEGGMAAWMREFASPRSDGAGTLAE